MTITIDQLVSREVGHCVSFLVSTLAQGYGALDSSTSDLCDAAEQAMELASTIQDYEAAVVEAGGELDKQADNDFGWRSDTGGEDWGFASQDAAARDFCDTYHLEPLEREVYEHWIVSDWLADRLAEQGEKVDKDFCGLTVWARTTTGQGIASDSVIERIYADLIAA